MAIFAKIVETRGITAAAAELGLSAPTVSKALARLEQRLGSRLLNRTSRRFALTDAGHALAERAAKLLADAEAAQDALLAQSATPRGVVRLGRTNVLRSQRGRANPAGFPGTISGGLS